MTVLALYVGMFLFGSLHIDDRSHSGNQLSWIYGPTYSAVYRLVLGLSSKRKI